MDPRAYEYVFALQQARELMPFAEDLAEVTFIGHSHLCKAFAFGGGQVADVVAQKFAIRRGFSTSSPWEVSDSRETMTTGPVSWCATQLRGQSNTFEFRMTSRPRPGASMRPGWPPTLVAGSFLAYDPEGPPRSAFGTSRRGPD